VSFNARERVAVRWGPRRLPHEQAHSEEDRDPGTRPASGPELEVGRSLLREIAGAAFVVVLPALLLGIAALVRP